MNMNQFAAIAIILACAGLFGLSSHIVQQRVKEIGIRKVMGASVLNILGILSGNFARLIFLAVVIGSLVAYIAMEQWLRDFAYRIEIQWWVPVAAGALAIGIALATISFQALKAAMANPVESLRSE